jgi:hypothetical protein
MDPVGTHVNSHNLPIEGISPPMATDSVFQADCSTFAAWVLLVVLLVSRGARTRHSAYQKLLRVNTSEGATTARHDRSAMVVARNMPWTLLIAH